MPIAQFWDSVAGTGHWERQIRKYGVAQTLRSALDNTQGQTVDKANPDFEKAAFILLHLEKADNGTSPTDIKLEDIHWALAVSVRKDKNFLLRVAAPFAKKFFWDQELSAAVMILDPLVREGQWDTARTILETANYKMPLPEFLSLLNRALGNNRHDFAQNLITSVYAANSNWVFDEDSKEQLTETLRKTAAEIISRGIHPGSANAENVLIAALNSGMTEHADLETLEKIYESLSTLPKNEALMATFNTTLAQRHYAETVDIVTTQLPEIAGALVALQKRAGVLIEQFETHASKIENRFGDSSKAAEIRAAVTEQITPFVEAVEAISSKFGYHKLGETGRTTTLTPKTTA